MQDIAAAVRAGSDYLHQGIMSGRYGLSCIGNDGKPKFSNDKGHLFSIFHLVHALQGDISEVERTIFLMRILSEEYDGQWGYSPRGYYKESAHNPFFVDADDTSFALRTLRALGVYRSPETLMKYWIESVDSGSGSPAFVTFIAEHGPRSSCIEPTFAHNFQIHPEINANVYHCLLDSHYDKYISEDLIAQAQNDDGHWPSYFYPDAYYGTFLFMSLLAKTNTMPEHFHKGIKYILHHQADNGSWQNDPYQSALALKTLLLTGQNTESIERGIAFLLSMKTADGYWKTQSNIWRFADQDGDTWRAYDSNNIIATSLCIEVLKTYLKLKDPSE